MIKAKLSNEVDQQTRANSLSFMNVGRTSVGLFLLLILAILILLASFPFMNSVEGADKDDDAYGDPTCTPCPNNTGDSSDNSSRISLGAVKARGNGTDENRDGIDGVRDDLGTRGIPFGLWGLNDEARDLWGTKYTVSTIWTSPNTILDLLDEAQTKGMHVVISLSAFGKGDYQNSDCTFNLSCWKARVDLYSGINLDEYINDGTIIAHYLVDEPKSRSNWGGQVITNDVLDEMARYSKEIWPDMLTAVRATPLTLAEHAGGYEVRLPSWTWKYLDTAWLQYSSTKDDGISQYIANENQSANRQRLGLIVGLQALTGGDGSSGIPGPPGYTDRSAMSKDELLKYGTPLIDSPSSCAFLMWTYEYDLKPSYNYAYFNRPEIDASVQALKQLADQRPWHSCKFEVHRFDYDQYLPLLVSR